LLSCSGRVQKPVYWDFYHSEITSLMEFFFNLSNIF
jgi:hypothetical protein